MTRRTRFAAALLLPATMLPAQDARADDAEFWGLTCTLASVRDQGTFDPTVPRVGRLIAGPIVSGDAHDDPSTGPSHRELPGIRVRCWLQFDDIADEAHWASAASDTGAKRALEATGTGIAVRDSEAQYTIGPGQSVFTCTWWRIEHADIVESWFYDSDPTRVGDQCEQATSVSSGKNRGAWVTPPRPLIQPR